MMRLLSPLLCALIAACATDSPHDRTFVAKQIDERSGASLRPAASNEPMPPGTRLTDGLTEAEAVAIALWNNPGFLAALTDLDVSRAELAEAGAFRNPALSLLFPLGPKQFEMTLTLPIDALLHRPHRVAIARIEVERVGAQLVRSGLDLIRDTQLAFGGVLHAMDQSTLADQAAALAARRAELAQSRANAGDIGEQEAAAATVTAGLAAAASTRARGERARALLRLFDQLGLPPETPAPAMVAGDPPSEPPPVAELHRMALAARPDLRAAELVVEAVGERAGMTHAEVWQVALLADVNGSTREQDQVGPGVALELPVFNQRGGTSDKADAEVVRSLGRLTALRASLLNDLQQCWQSEAAARASIEELRLTAVPANQRELAMATRLVTAGEEREDVLLTAREHEVQLRQALADATASLRDARARLVHAVGRRL